jgi:hypothetical protein
MVAVEAQNPLLNPTRINFIKANCHVKSNFCKKTGDQAEIVGLL